MNPALESLADAARERPVPWSAERAARVERSIVRGRERSRLAVPAARFALGGLASVALFASFVRLSIALRDVLPLERESAVAGSSVAGSSDAVTSGRGSSGRGPSGGGPREGASGVGAPAEEPSDLDRPIGDGGFADSGQ
jgi:hypothetical protein